MNTRIIFLSSLFLTALPLHAEFRTWSNPSGTTLDAEFVKVEGENVTLRLRNGNLTTFSQTKLSEADREFIKNSSSQAAPAPQAAVPADRKARWLTKLDKAQEESKQTGLPILVLFTGTSWCPYCIKLEEAVFSQKEFKSFANQNLVLLLLDFGPGGDTKSKDDKKLQAEYGVKGFPTYFLTDASGAQLAKGGYNDGINPDVFAAWVKKAAPAKSSGDSTACAFGFCRGFCDPCPSAFICASFLLIGFTPAEIHQNRVLGSSVIAKDRKLGKIRPVKVRKAVITAAGKTQRTLPLQTLVDRDGTSRSALAILADEITSAGIEEIAVIICPGDEAAYTAAAGTHASHMRFIEQSEALGYGHAVHCAAAFTGDDPFLLMVGDHLYLSRSETSCTAQLLATAAAEDCAVSAVQATHESKLPLYGAIGGRRVPGSDLLYQVETVIEKPTPTEAEQKLVVPGLRAGNYLCFFGLHVLTPTVMNILARQLVGGRADLSSALSEIARSEQYLAHELQGRRHDIGVHYGLLTAQLALGLAGKDRDEILTNIVELLAQSHA